MSYLSIVSVICCYYSLVLGHVRNLFQHLSIFMTSYCPHFAQLELDVPDDDDFFPFLRYFLG